MQLCKTPNANPRLLCKSHHLQSLTQSESKQSRNQTASGFFVRRSKLFLVSAQLTSLSLSPWLSFSVPEQDQQVTLWFFILVSHCLLPSYSQACSCQSAQQNTSIYITKFLADIPYGLSLSCQFPQNSVFYSTHKFSYIFLFTLHC